MANEELAQFKEGKKLLDKSTIAMSPYPCELTFVTGTTDWDTVMRTLQHYDPGCDAIKHVGKLAKEGPSVVYVKFDNTHTFIMGANVYDPTYFAKYHNMLVGSAAILAQQIVVKLSNLIGHNIMISAGPTGSVIDWVVRNWVNFICNQFECSAVFVPYDTMRLGQYAPELISPTLNAFDILGSISVQSILRRECMALVNHTVKVDVDGWKSVTFLNGGFE